MTANEILLNKKKLDFNDIFKDKNISDNVLKFLSNKIYNPQLILTYYDLENFDLKDNHFFIYFDIKEILEEMSTISMDKFDSVNELENWLSTHKSIDNCICFLQLDSSIDILEATAKWTDKIAQKLEKNMLLGWEVNKTKYKNNSLVIITDTI